MHRRACHVLPDPALPDRAIPCLACLASPRLNYPHQDLPSRTTPAKLRRALPCRDTPERTQHDTDEPKPAMPAVPRHNSQSLTSTYRALPATPNGPSRTQPCLTSLRLTGPSLPCHAQQQQTSRHQTSRSQNQPCLPRFSAHTCQTGRPSRDATRRCLPQSHQS